MQMIYHTSVMTPPSLPNLYGIYGIRITFSAITCTTLLRPLCVDASSTRHLSLFLLPHGETSTQIQGADCEMGKAT